MWHAKCQKRKKHGIFTYSGNMWSQDWSDIFDRIVPYPDASKFDITDVLKKVYTFRILAYLLHFPLALLKFNHATTEIPSRQRRSDRDL